MTPAVEIPAIVLEALDQPRELVELLFERIKLDVSRLQALGVSKGAIVQETGLGRRYGRPLGAKTGGERGN